MTTECEHDFILSRCAKCDKSIKDVILNGFSSVVLAECEASALQIGTGWYVSLEKIRKLMRKWES
jgi:hypothetical protein